ncbi:MAG: hypothetical protein AAB404_00715 [Patescibacteria group bacterium]
MSWVLSDSTPKNLVVKSYPRGLYFTDRPCVRFGKYTMSMEDFLCAAHYVLTNTDLEKKDGKNDPRLDFVKKIKKMKIVDGYNKERDKNAKRLSLNGFCSIGYIAK